MARITFYVVQTFVETAEGLVAEEPSECATAADACFKARMLSSCTAGVVAWAKIGDPDTGVWDDDPVILFQAGRTGD